MLKVVVKLSVSVQVYGLRDDATTGKGGKQCFH